MTLRRDSDQCYFKMKENFPGPVFWLLLHAVLWTKPAAREQW